MIIRTVREKIYLPVEGESEQSFVKLLQQFCDQKNLNKHLDCQILKGGGYKSMLKKAGREQKKYDRKRAKKSILLVDSDRANFSDDGWTIDILRQEALKYNMNVCVQNPNLEGLFLRILLGRKQKTPKNSNIKSQLLAVWPNYKKPVDATTLAKKITLNDLLYIAQSDKEMYYLLSQIGLIEEDAYIKEI